MKKIDSGEDYYNHNYHETLHKNLIEDNKYFELRARASKDIIFKNIELSGKQILEYGCGIGHNISLINNAWGFDISKVARDSCKKRRINVFNEVSEINENAWDIILCSHVLEHLEEPLAHLKLFYNFLKINGLLIIILPKEYHSKPKISSHFDINQHLYSWNFKTLSNLLNRAGFIVEKQRYRPVLGFKALIPIYKIFGYDSYLFATKIIGFLYRNYWIMVYARKGP
jgi:SAM-dependent methyltransferase